MSDEDEKIYVNFHLKSVSACIGLGMHFLARRSYAKGSADITEFIWPHIAASRLMHSN